MALVDALYAQEARSSLEMTMTSRLNDTTDSFHSWFDEPEMLECMLNLPEVEVLERINIRRIIPYKEPTGWL